MNQKQITVDVAPDGSVKIEAHGFVGPTCEKATKFLEDALGVQTKKIRKAEYTQPVKSIQQGKLSQ